MRSDVVFIATRVSNLNKQPWQNPSYIFCVYSQDDPVNVEVSGQFDELPTKPNPMKPPAQKSGAKSNGGKSSKKNQ